MIATARQHLAGDVEALTLLPDFQFVRTAPMKISDDAVVGRSREIDLNASSNVQFIETGKIICRGGVCQSSMRARQEKGGNEQGLEHGGGPYDQLPKSMSPPLDLEMSRVAGFPDT